MQGHAWCKVGTGGARPDQNVKLGKRTVEWYKGNGGERTGGVGTRPDQAQSATALQHALPAPFVSTLQRTSTCYHIFELEIEMPKFSMYAAVDKGTVPESASKVTFK